MARRNSNTVGNGQLSHKDELSRLEWDFSACPARELRDCYLYEYGREIDAVRVSVRKWRRENPGPSFDDWIGVAGSASRGNRPQVFGWFFFNFYPEFPKRPFLSVPTSERQRRRALMPTLMQKDDPKNALKIVPLPHILNNTSTPQTEYWKNSPQQNLTIKSADEIHETVAFQIDWRHSLATIENLFRNWVKSNSPTHVKKWIVKGKGRSEEQIKKALKALGAARLLRIGSWTEAEETTANCSPTDQSLFTGQPHWIGAKKNFQKCLKEFPR